MPDNPYPEEHLADLLRRLRPAPEAWVRAAQELPRARREMDEIVARAEADARFREQLLADMESALEAAGYEPEHRLLEDLRRHYGSDGD